MSQPVQLPSWAQQFKIDETSWANLCKEAEKNHFTPLDVALDMGLLNENKLILWDCHFSGLASLRSVFFNGEPPFDLWKTQDFKKCRSHACMPVGRWEDKIIWAKIISLPTPMDSEDPTRVWVLAPWTGLKKWFALWQATVEAAAIEVQAPVIELPIQPEIQPEIQQAGQPEIHIEAQVEAPIAVNFDAPAGLKINDEVKHAEEIVVDKIESEMPVGLGKNDKELSIDFSGISILGDDDVHAPVVASPAPVIQQVAPENPGSDLSAFELDISMDDLSVPLAVAAPSIKLEVPPPPPLKVEAPIIPVTVNPPKLAAIPRPPVSAASPDGGLPPPIPLDAHSVPGFVLPPVPSTQKIQTPPAPPKIAIAQPLTMPVSIAPMPMATPAMATPAISKPPAPVIQSISPIQPVGDVITTPMPSNIGELATIPLDQLEPRLKHTTNQDSLAQVFMGAWQNYFDKIMILLLQNESLIMWWHNNRWRSNVVKGEKIPLDGPSIFKVVMDSQHPYHGYLAASEVNDLFFQKTNAGEYPEHVSVIPVSADDRVVTVLVGTCSKNAGANLVLSRLEDDARIFSASMMRVKSVPKKAG